MKKAFSLLLFTVFVFTGCTASDTTSTTSGDGYSDRQLSENVYEVRYSGDGYMSSDQVRDFWMFGAAQLASQNGHQHFAILQEGTETSESTIRGDTRYTATDIGNATIITESGGDFDVTRHQARGRILLLTEEEAEELPEGAALNADIIIEQYEEIDREQRGQFYAQIDVDGFDSLLEAAREVVADHPEQAERFRDGEPLIMGFFIKEVLQATDNSADKDLAKEALQYVLSE